MLQNLIKYEERSFVKDLNKVGDQKSKLLKMYKLIKLRKVIDQDQVTLSLYGNLDKKSLEAYRKLCDRMIDKVFNLLANFENYLQDKNEYSDVHFKRVYVNRNLFLIQSLKYKYLPSDWNKKLIQSTLKICDEYEYLEESIILDRHNLLCNYENGNHDKIIFYTNEIRRRMNWLNYVLLADNYIYKYIEDVQHKSIDDKSRISEMKIVVKELEEYFLETELQLINYILLMIKLQLAHYEEKFNKAEDLIFEIIRVTEFYPAIKKRGPIVQNYMNLAYTQFYLFKFNDAFNSAMKAVNVFKDKVYVMNMNLESVVFAQIYLIHYAKADKILQEILSSGVEGNNPEQLSKRHVMMAFLKYLQGDYKTAFKHLQLTKEVETDREGWNLGIRMLNIYLTLSTEKVDLADQRINAMRKHIERTSKMRNLRKRDIIIFRILSHLSRSGFDFEEVWEERKKDFALLRSNTPDCNWVPRSHELIIFDQWFEAKMKNKPYVPVFPSPKTEYEEEAVDISQMESV